MNRMVLLLLLSIFSLVGALEVEPHTTPAKWNDTTRVAIIWNDGTGNEELSDDWKYDIKVGDLGSMTKGFVKDALYHLSDANIKEYYGMMSEWEDLTLDSIKADFKDKLPHVIIYVNAGYEWGQEFSSSLKPKTPYNIITKATEAGIGIIAVGDDAAYDAKKIFPLTGPGGKGAPIQYDDKYPYMAGAVDYPPYYINRLMITIENDDPVVDSSLLWNVPQGDLRFKEYEKNGRGQSDADIWDVDTSQLDDYFIVGYQRARVSEQQWYDGGVSSYYVGNTPQNEIIPSATTYKQGASYQYNALAGLQDGNHRIVMVGYQPQYLDDEDASAQIIYNAVYWTSKAHKLLKINTPKADPNGGAVQTIDKVSLSVTYPKNKDLYEIYYTLDGSTPKKGSSKKYTGSFELGTKSETVTLKAIAFSNDDDWVDSDMLTVKYTYEGGPIVDSAYFQPAQIVDFVNSTRDEDTLTVFFNTPVEKIQSSRPFNFKDSDGNDYVMRLTYQKADSNVVTFSVTSFDGKSSTYLPKDRKDSLIVNEEKNIISTGGIKQDGTNNVFGPIIVLPPHKSVDIQASWIDTSNSDKSIEEIFDDLGTSIPYDEGVLIVVDPKTSLTKEEYEQFKLTFSVIDPVGNIIVESNNENCFQTVEVVNGRPQLFAVWNGKNRKQRSTAGSLLLQLQFKDHEGDIYQETKGLSLPVK